MLQAIDLQKYRKLDALMRKGKTVQPIDARRVIILRQCNWRCVKCGRPRSLTIDHRKQVGSRRHKNYFYIPECVVLCRKCHERKNTQKNLKNSKKKAVPVVFASQEATYEETGILAP